MNGIGVMFFGLAMVGIFFNVVFNSHTAGDTLWAIDYGVDRLIENGLIKPHIDYDDPVLNESRTIIITEGINEKTSKEVVSKLLYLNQMNANEPINLIVKTIGGWQDDAFLIVDTMMLIDAPVNTISLGGSHSAGAIILAGGTGIRKASINSLIMIHTLDESWDEDYSYDLVSRNRMESFWRSQGNLPEEFYPMDEEKEYYLTPEEALKYNLIDEIIN